MFFNAVREGDLVVFACEDEQDRALWVQAMYRATGQSYKPAPPPHGNNSKNRGPAGNKPASPISKCSRSSVSQRCSTPPKKKKKNHITSILMIYNTVCQTWGVFLVGEGAQKWGFLVKAKPMFDHFIYHVYYFCFTIGSVVHFHI